MTRLLRMIVLLAVSCLPALLFAQQPEAVTFPDARSLRGVTLSGDGKLVAYTATSPRGAPEAVICDATTGKERSRFPLIRAQINSTLAFSADQNRLLIGSFGARERGGPSLPTLEVWDLIKGQRLQAIDAEQWEGNRGIFTPDGKSVVVANWQGAFSLYDLTTGKRLVSPECKHARCERLALSPDGKTLITGHRGGQVKVWDLLTFKELHLYEASKKSITAIAFSPKGDQFAFACGECFVSVYDTKTGKLVKKTNTDRRHGLFKINGLAFLPDGKSVMLVGCGSPPGLLTWDFTTGDAAGCQAQPGRKQPVPKPTSFNKVAFSPDANHLVTFDGEIKLWDVPATIKQLAPSKPRR